MTVDKKPSLRPDFLWGFATAAAQMESGSKEQDKASGKGDSIWDYFCEKPGAIADGSKVSRTTDFYTHWKEDLARESAVHFPRSAFSLNGVVCCLQSMITDVAPYRALDTDMQS